MRGKKRQARLRKDAHATSDAQAEEHPGELIMTGSCRKVEFAQRIRPPCSAKTYLNKLKAGNKSEKMRFAKTQAFLEQIADSTQFANIFRFKPLEGVILQIKNGPNLTVFEIKLHDGDRFGGYFAPSSSTFVLVTAFMKSRDRWLPGKIAELRNGVLEDYALRFPPTQS